MNERKGWLFAFLGAAIMLLACLGTSVFAFLWSSAVLEGIMH